jgi:hypothetical protein
VHICCCTDLIDLRSTISHNDDPQSVIPLPPILTTLSLPEPTSPHLQHSSEVPHDNPQLHSGVVTTVSTDPPMDATTIIITTTALSSSLSPVYTLSSTGINPASAIPAALTDPKNSTKSKAGTIAGILIGALAFLGGSVLLTRRIWRQRKFRKHKEEQKETARFYREKLIRRVYPLQ